MPLVTAGVGAYFGSYLKTRGENRAMHKDIDVLKEKIEVVTTTTEQIKTEISDAAWNRQWRLNLKREVLFDVMKKISRVDEALASLKWYASGWPNVSRGDRRSLLWRSKCCVETGASGI